MVPELCVAPKTVLNQNGVMGLPGVGEIVRDVVRFLVVGVQDVSAAVGVGLQWHDGAYLGPRSFVSTLDL
jgi:hypothetical protein